MSARWAEALALLLLAWTVAVPLSAWFAQARWTAREPVAALVMWQAIGLSGGLAVLTGELTVAAADHDGPWRDGVAAVVDTPSSGGVAGAVGLALFAVSTAWLVGVLVSSFVRVVRSRRDHRALLELLSQSGRAHGTEFDVIETSSPVAYSLPGRSAHVVLSSATTALLGSDELRAVLAHERAHLRQRHGVLVQPFVAWQRSLPFLRSPAMARRRVEQLTEMVCDDISAAETGAVTLSSALSAILPPGSDLEERTSRLRDLGRRAVRLRISLVLVAAALLFAPPLVLVSLPT